MPHQDPLAKALGKAPADAVRAAFVDRNRTIGLDESDWKAHGFTGAKLVAVVVEPARASHENPQRYIAKVSPPGAAVPENAQHDAAFQHTDAKTFPLNHMVRVAFDPVRCPTGEVVSFQNIAGDDFDGMAVLSNVRGRQLDDVCRQVRRGLLEEWTGRACRRSKMTIPELLRCELGDLTSGWVVPNDVGWIMTDEDGTFPNPLALLSDDALSMARPETRFVGYVHGDLHPDNILVPQNGLGSNVDQYRLIDFATFEPSAPLTRDLATLLVSLLSHRVKDLDQAELDDLLHFLPTPGNQPTEAPTDLAAVIRTLCDPGDAPFASTWRGPWNKQMHVSILAQAVRHSTYDSVGPAGRWWCLRLAGLLARRLLPDPRPDGHPTRLVPEMFAVVGASDGLPIRPIIDQEGTRKQLREAMESPGLGVILLLGPAGVGKSAIARAVAAELRIRGVRVVEHRATAMRRPDAMTLIESLENGTANDRLRPGETVHIRLRAALDALDRPAVIVIDQAEVLLDDETGAVVDAELDQALEAIATAPAGTAKVLLVARTRPSSAQGCTWPRAATPIGAEGLRQPYFDRLLRVLNEPVGTGLTGLTESQADTLRDRLGGNPLYAWLAQVIVQSVGSEYGAGALVDEVAARSPDEVPRFLADAFKSQLHDHSRRLLAALAAFGTPVEPDAVAALVQQWLPSQHATSLLQKLADQRLVTVIDGLYSLLPSDPYLMLDEPPVEREVWRRMLWDAARQLGFRLKADDDVTGVDDLYRHFALIDVLRRTRRYEAALSKMDELDVLLRRWDSEALLLGRRQHIRDLLTDPRPKMVNLNSLGDLYRSRGRLDDAAEAFQSALDIAVREGDPSDRLPIQINMAAMYWDLGETGKAADLFGLTLSEADLREAVDDQLAASEGLADCHRRWGNYRKAMPLAQRALSLARETGSDGTVSIALKLARWSAELGDLATAERCVAEARDEAENQPDSTLHTACDDARADLLLDRGQADRALILADEVLARARRQRSLLVQLQAHTIRCMAYLRIEPVDLAAAQDAINAANRVRRTQRSLIVPALRALTIALDGRNEEASRCFDDLRDEAERRGRDPEDVSALQMLGFARCWWARHSDQALRSAVDAFRAARNRTDQPAKGTEELLTFLVRQLGTCGGQPGRLDPVLNAISGANPWPEHG